MKHVSILIEGLVKEAKVLGLTAKDLAERAGLRPSNFARIRKTGKFNADTLERLLAAVDCDLELVRRPRFEPRVLSFVCSKLNAGRKQKLSENELRKFLTKFRASKAAEGAYSHLIGLVEEVPLEQIHDLIRQNDATLSSLKRIADYVDGEGETVEWVHDQITA